MRIFFSVVLLAVMVSGIQFLAGCSYFDTAETIDVSVQPVSRVNLMTGEVGYGNSTYDTMDLRQITYAVSGGSVEVFPLDGPLYGENGYQEESGIAVSSVAAVPPGGYESLYGLPYRLDPSVQVFPLDEQMQEIVPRAYLPLSYKSPSMMPPTSARPDYPSPFDDLYHGVQ